MEVSVTGPIVQAETAWQSVSESGLLLRLAGAPPIHLQWAEDGDGEVVPAGVMLGPAGLRHQFVDRSIRWVRGQFLSFERQISGPLLREIQFEATLTEQDGGVRPELSLRVVPRIGGTGAFVRLYTRGVRKGWTRELDRMGPEQRSGSLLRRPLDMTATAALIRWSDRGGSPALRARVETWLRQAPARALHDLRPLALAMGWEQQGAGMEESLLDDVVEALAAGVLDMRWVVFCPRCRAEVMRTATLSGLTEQARCPACGTVRPVDLVNSVEVVLLAPGWMAAIEPTCHAIAAWWKDVEAAALLAPGERVALPLSLDPGTYALVAGAGAEALDGQLIIREGGPATADWSPGDGTVELGTGVLTLHNPNGRRHFVRVVRTVSRTRRLTAFAMLTRPRFQRRLGGQAPAPDVVLEVADATVLFTDFTDSAAYFDRLGDREAVGRMRSRLAIVLACLHEHGGTRVKTLGDGLMALFADPAAAVGAALELLGGPVCGHPDEPQLRVGISRGPILTEHTDAAGLDCLGATVAQGAMAVYRARPRSARWTEAVQSDPAVQRIMQTVSSPIQRDDDGLYVLCLDVV